jgi:glycosyltransferase involved in cell wall biosynthesis
MAEVDVIIPVYQPRNDWASHLAGALNRELDDAHLYTLVIVNDGGQALNSEDKKTLQQISGSSHFKEVRIIEYEDNQGKGYAIRKGILASSGPYILYTDDDLPYGVHAINEMVDRLSDNGQVALPDRGSDYFRSLPLKRRIISRGLIMMNIVLMRMKHADTQAGLKGFHRAVSGMILEGKEHGFLFEVEWILRAEKAGVSIATIPVKINEKTIPSGVPGGDVWKLLRTYFRLFRSR